MRIILASASPRRRELLEQIGVSFETAPAKGEEIITKEIPKEVVMELSMQKAVEIYERGKNDSLHQNKALLVIGADTIVSYGNRILGKPKDEADAFAPLTLLQGKQHEVYTGVTLLLKEAEKEKKICFAEKTKVFMYPMTETEIRNYIKTGEPMDKAGSYGIQGKCAAFIEKIDGDYNNVVGLPIAKIYQKLLQLGIDILHVS